jgi:hypothetical protein
MPWEIKEDTPQCSGYGVFKEGTSELEGCHETKEKAQAQMAALYSTEEMDKNMSNISKAMVLEGDFVTFVCEDDERKIGRVEYVMNNPGTLGMEGSEYSVEYMENDKPIIVRLYEEEDGAWEEEQYLVYKRMSDVIKIESITVSQEIEVEMVSKAYQDCGCPTCKEMDVACEDCPVCNPDMGKADSVRVGQMVSWESSGGNARGKVKRVIRDGSYNVPDSDFTITGTPENPAVVIEIYRDDKPTGRMVGHKMNTLRVTKSLWSSFDPRQAVTARPAVDLFKRDYSRESRERMASGGKAMPDGSFPIANREDLRRAIQSVGRASNYDAVRRHIIRRARALGASDMLPEDWK